MNNNFKKTKLLIKIIEEKMVKDKSIKKELNILKYFYNYLTKNNIETNIIEFLEPLLPQLQSYQDEYNKKEALRIEQKNKEIKKINKLQEYKSLWKEKSTVYKLFHYGLNPKKIILKDIYYEDIIEKIGKLK